MVNQTANVVAGKPLATGGVLLAQLGATLPTDANGSLNSGFTSAGYIGEDGLTENADRSTDKIKAWGGDIVKVVQTDFSCTYEFTFIESLNTTVLNAVYGAENVETTEPTSSKGTLHSVAVKSDMLPYQVFVFEVRDGNARIRVVVPNGQITTVGEITYNDSSVIGYAVTVEAFPEQGVNAYKYLDNGVTSSNGGGGGGGDDD